jgi:hypothetical protein
MKVLLGICHRLEARKHFQKFEDNGDFTIQLLPLYSMFIFDFILREMERGLRERSRIPVSMEIIRF